MRRRSLPLGVDIGTTRIRVAHAERTVDGVRLRAVAVREYAPGSATSGGIADPSYIAALLDEAVAELGTRERRCVCALGEPDARLRAIAFPPMTAFERERSARFEAERYVEYPVEEAIVRAHPVDASKRLWALGIARASVLAQRVGCLKEAGLKTVAVDHESCAFTRVLGEFDAVVDVGHDRTSLHVVRSALPSSTLTKSGGAAVTRGIERELAIDINSAEKRKRILGTAGAGERARQTLAGDIAALVDSARARFSIDRIAFVGNGARLGGLCQDVAAATGAVCEAAVSAVLRGEAYPEDVVRCGAPDWTLAAGLCAWGTP